MNVLEKFMSKCNFKKIAAAYVVLLLVTGIACAATVGYLYRERLTFAFEYSRLEEALKKGEDAIFKAADKTAGASSDVVDILVLDGNNKVLHSSKNSEFATEYFTLEKSDEQSKYLVCENFAGAVFRHVGNDEFMLNSVLNRDFGKIRSDYDDDSFYESSDSSKAVYMLSCIRHRGVDAKIYVIATPTSVRGGMTALKISAAAAMFFFCVYWVLIALWMYKDASKSKLSATYWGLIGLFTNLVGLIVYKIYKRNTAVCPSCGAACDVGHLYCSHCGTRLGITCENCGGRVGKDDIFCHGCGHKLK